jgi:hypothetical protein
MTVLDAVQIRQVSRSQPCIGAIMRLIIAPVQSIILCWQAEMPFGIHIVMCQVEQRVKHGVKTFKRPPSFSKGAGTGSGRSLAASRYCEVLLYLWPRGASRREHHPQQTRSNDGRTYKPLGADLE